MCASSNNIASDLANHIGSIYLRREIQVCEMRPTCVKRQRDAAVCAPYDIIKVLFI